MIGGLAIAAGVHALFNVVAFTQTAWPVAILLVILGTTWTLRRFDWAQRVSPFRYRRNYPRVQCAYCRQHIRVTSRYCHFCGAPVHQRPTATFCGHCDTRNRPDASFCTQCGDQLLT